MFGGIFDYHMKHIKLHRPCSTSYGILWIHSVRWILIHHVYVYTLPYLICSCSFSHKACNTWPSGLGVGQWVMSHICKKNPHYWNKTHIQSYVYFSRPCLSSHIQSWNYQKICVGVFWGQYIFGAGILFWKAPWGLRPCHFKSGVLFLGCVYFCFIKKLYKY